MSIDSLDYYNSQSKNYEQKCIKALDIVNDILSSDIEQVVSPLSESNCKHKLQGLSKKFGNPNITISIVAEVSSGKSTFLNALIFGGDVLHSGVGAVTARLFKINYSDKYFYEDGSKAIECESIDELKRCLVELNQSERRNIEDKTGKYNKNVVNVGVRHPMLKKGITVYDTPGFGSLDEGIVFDIIERAVEESDGTIMLLDIHSGMKKGEDRFVRQVINRIESSKRFVVFNKMDTVINDDMRVVMSNEEVEKQIHDVTQKAIINVAESAKINPDEIRHYHLSSLKALSGYILNNKEKIIESGFKEFQDDFWDHIIKNKSEILCTRIKSANSCMDQIANVLSIGKKESENNLKQIEKIKNDLVQRNEELKSFFNHKISSLHDINKSLSTTTYSIHGIVETIKSILKDKIKNRLDSDIGFFDKAIIFGLKGKYEKCIVGAINDSKSDMNSSVSNYINSIFSSYIESQNKINTVIDLINDKINEFEGYNIDNIERLDIFQKNLSGEYEFNPNSSYADDLGVAKDLLVGVAGGAIGGVAAQVIATRLAFMIPGIGLIVGAVLTIVLTLLGSSTDSNKKIADEVSDKIASGMREDLEKRMTSILDQLNLIKTAIMQASHAAQIRLKTILDTIEKPEEKEKQIEKLKRQMDEINIFQERLSKIQTGGNNEHYALGK
ncbi:dynamin family protein [Desulfonatronovibrio magnus]|uniref:dynamin family protein n=1 Tax=Desulfonatronovibrio magnus TaxID=698827 RepID=UPI0005EAEF01|nr:dynamin family protein [Desulfonatronovibrio magnus]